MEEELGKILANAELDETGKADAIKDLIGKSFVPTSKFKEEKAKQTQAYNTLKSEYDSFKETKMTDEEKQAEQAKLMQEQYKKANLTISKMYAENTFAKAGFKEEDYKGILENIVQEDAEKTKGLAELICNTMLNQRKTLEKEITDKIIKGTKKPEAGNANDSGTQTDLEKYQKLLEEAQKEKNMVNIAYYTRLVQQAKLKNED